MLFPTFLEKKSLFLENIEKCHLLVKYGRWFLQIVDREF